MIYNSTVKKEIFNEFVNQNGVSLMNHVANTCGIEEFIAVASVLCPEVIKVNDCIFISEFYQNNIEQLEEQFENDRKRIEQFVNSWSLGDFFLESYTYSVENETIINQFGEVLVHFWGKRMKELFPNRNVVVEIGENIMGESGLVITLYQE
ncbi:hypothetical protein EBB07_11580 [Paenibacillaceae bacterium]|nr:hypothetical protein EBB07_11580 [Paenibacillaceae bacterium]